MKLLAFDIDQTLIDDTFDENGDWVVFPEVIDALNTLLIKGNAVLFASGRPYSGIKIFMDRLMPSNNVYAASSNGAALFTRDGRILSSHYIPFCSLDEMIACFPDHPNYTYMVYFQDNVLGYKGKLNFAPIEAKSNNMKMVDLNITEVKGDCPVEKTFINLGNENSSTIIAPKEMREKYEAFASGANFYEFIHKGVSKASSARELAALLHIDHDDIYGFGDGENDYELVRDFHGTALSNSIKKVQDVAEYVSTSVKERGAVKALKEKWHLI